MKIQVQKLKSSKLFYGKWPYRIATQQHWANRIVRNGVNNVKLWCRTGKGLYAHPWNKETQPNPFELLEFVEAIEPYLGRKDLRIRAEGNHLNIFCMDKVLLAELENVLRKWITHISGPTTDEELEYLLSNGRKKVLCDQLPKEKYKYKLIFKTSFPENKRDTFLQWLSKYDDKVNLSKSTEKWLLGSKHWIQDPFIYVEDDKMLSMIGLYLSGYVKRIDEFIPRDSVLTA